MSDNTEGAGEQDKHCETSTEGVHQVKVFLGLLLGYTITSLVALEGRKTNGRTVQESW